MPAHLPGGMDRPAEPGRLHTSAVQFDEQALLGFVQRHRIRDAAISLRLTAADLVLAHPRRFDTAEDARVAAERLPAALRGENPGSAHGELRRSSRQAEWAPRPGYPRRFPLHCTHVAPSLIAALAGLMPRPAPQRAIEEAQNDPVKLYARREALDSDMKRRSAISRACRHASPSAGTPSRHSSVRLLLPLREPDSAIATTEQFIKNYPRHPDIDYAYYLRGLANFSQTDGLLDNLLDLDPTKRDPRTAHDSFRYFSELVRRFPDSAYAADAVQRMVHLKNHLARHELHVADYYMRRKAYVAVVSRAKYVVENYPQTPAVPRALEMMAEAYDRLGLDELAQDARRVLAANPADAGS